MTFASKRPIELIGWTLLGMVITVVTLGIYGFWIGIALEKWKVKNTVFE